MLTQRLAAAEEQLALLRHETLAAQLADTKLALAQSEFHVMQLQVSLPSGARRCWPMMTTRFID